MTEKEELIELVEHYLKNETHTFILPYRLEDIQGITTTNTLYGYLTKEAFTIYTPEYITFAYFSFALDYLFEEFDDFPYVYMSRSLVMRSPITLHREGIPILAKFIRNYIPRTNINVHSNNIQVELDSLVYDMFQYCYTDRYLKMFKSTRKILNLEEKVPRKYPTQYWGISETLNRLYVSELLLPEILHACNIPFTVSEFTHLTY